MAFGVWHNVDLLTTFLFCCEQCELLEGCRNAFWCQLWLRTVHLKFLGLTSLWFCLGSCLVSRTVGYPEIPPAWPLSLHPLWFCPRWFLNIPLFQPFDLPSISCLPSACPSCTSLPSNASHLAVESYILVLLMRHQAPKWALGLSVLFFLSLSLMKNLLRLFYVSEVDGSLIYLFLRADLTEELTEELTPSSTLYFQILFHWTSKELWDSWGHSKFLMKREEWGKWRHCLCSGLCAPTME